MGMIVKVDNVGVTTYGRFEWVVRLNGSEMLSLMLLLLFLECIVVSLSKENKVTRFVSDCRKEMNCVSNG